jgi:hypothetical protein
MSTVFFTTVSAIPLTAPGSFMFIRGQNPIP